MSSEAIQGVAPIGLAEIAATQQLQHGVEQLSTPIGVRHAAGATFGGLVSQGLQQVNNQLLAEQTDLQQLALGDVQNLHQIMIRMEETRLSFQLLLQVRNRLLEAYQDVMKMQI